MSTEKLLPLQRDNPEAHGHSPQRPDGAARLSGQRAGPCCGCRDVRGPNSQTFPPLPARV